MKKFSYKCACGWSGHRRSITRSSSVPCGKKGCDLLAKRQLSQNIGASYEGLASGTVEAQQTGAASLDTSFDEAVKASAKLGWQNAAQRHKVKKGLMYDFNADSDQITRLPQMPGRGVGYSIVSKSKGQKNASDREELKAALSKLNDDKNKSV
jgi:hypothetical protein